MNGLDSTLKPPGATKKPAGPSIYRFLVGLTLAFVPLSAIYRYGEILQHQHGMEYAVPAQSDCGITLTGGQGRVREGIVLLSRKQIHKLIISGVNARSTLQDIYPDIVFYPDVSLSDIVLEKTSASTASNAQHSLLIAEALNCKNTVLITSDYHMYRAYRTFQTIFPPTIRVSPYPVPSDRFKSGHDWLFAPRTIGIVVEEAFKFFFYAVTVF